MPRRQRFMFSETGSPRIDPPTDTERPVHTPTAGFTRPMQMNGASSHMAEEAPFVVEFFLTGRPDPIRYEYTHERIRLMAERQHLSVKEGDDLGRSSTRAWSRPSPPQSATRHSSSRMPRRPSGSCRPAASSRFGSSTWRPSHPSARRGPSGSAKTLAHRSGTSAWRGPCRRFAAWAPRPIGRSGLERAACSASTDPNTAPEATAPMAAAASGMPDRPDRRHHRANIRDGPR